jgi:hypothetical protein
MLRKRLFIIFIILYSSSLLYSQECPELQLKFGTKRNDILFELGEPKIAPDSQHLVYESYSTNTLETMVFIFDKDLSLIGISMTISPQYNTSLPLEEYLNKVYKKYLDMFTGVYGKPKLLDGNKCYWRYDNAFVVFMPYKTQEGFPKYYFIMLLKEYAKDYGFGFLYE